MSEYLPSPDPNRFPELKPEHLRILGTDTMLGRIFFRASSHRAEWNTFRHFGPTTALFDHHPEPPANHPSHGVLYAAPSLTDARGRQMSSLETALAECFRDTGTIDPHTFDPYFALFRPVRPLRLLDLADGPWLTQAGGNAAISSGPRAASRAWARATVTRYTKDALDGVLYTCSNVPRSRSVCLWQGAASALPERPTLHEPLSAVGLRPALEFYGSTLGLPLIAGR